MIFSIFIGVVAGLILGVVFPQPKWAVAAGAWVKAKFFKSDSAPTVGVTVPGPQDTNKPV